MKKHLLIFAGTAAFALAPAVTFAQSDAGGTPPSATDMKGPPNANGYSKDSQGRSASEGAGNSSSNGSDMKGPPNADGAAKATGSK